MQTPKRCISLVKSKNSWFTLGKLNFLDLHLHSSHLYYTSFLYLYSIWFNPFEFILIWANQESLQLSIYNILLFIKMSFSRIAYNLFAKTGTFTVSLENVSAFNFISSSFASPIVVHPLKTCCRFESTELISFSWGKKLKNDC